MNPYAAPQPGFVQPPGPVPPAPGTPTTGLRVLAILQIVLGGLALLWIPVTLTMASFEGISPVSHRMHELTWGGALGVWTRTQIGFGGILSTCLVVGGVGMLRVRPWARILSLAYAAAALLLAAVSQVIAYAVIYPALEKVVTTEFAGDPVASAVVYSSRYIGIIFGVVLAAALPVSVLVVLTRKTVKAQFGVS
jgi:hypothetical protein